jgi:hypothetical protein
MVLAYTPTRRRRCCAAESLSSAARRLAGLLPKSFCRALSAGSSASSAVRSASQAAVGEERAQVPDVHRVGGRAGRLGRGRGGRGFGQQFAIVELGVGGTQQQAEGDGGQRGGTQAGQA